MAYPEDEDIDISDGELLDQEQAAQEDMGDYEVDQIERRFEKIRRA